MLKGLDRLSGYGGNFRKAKNACVAFLAYYIIYTIMWILNILKIFDYGKIFSLVYADQILYRTILVVFSVFLYRALGDISRQVGFEKGIKREKSCTSLVIVFVIFLAIQLLLSFISIGKYEAYLNLALVIFELLWLISSAVYIYSCYMMIATQDIIDEENKKMREYDRKYSFRNLKKK
ncbi:MAG: hypothetical protein IJ939_05060 [Clostridia bacterium]|nr:hypothetical protein [Clostridia bacterium]